MNPQATNHLLTAERHFRMAQELAFSPPQTIRPEPSEWVITCAFYSAVHYLTAYFLEKYGSNPSSHVDRRSVMEQILELEPILDAYTELLDWSRTARYDALPALDWVVQPALDDLNHIATEIKRLLGAS